MSRVAFSRSELFVRWYQRDVAICMVVKRSVNRCIDSSEFHPRGTDWNEEPA